MRCQTLGPEADWQEIAIASDGQHVAARTALARAAAIATNPWHEVAQVASPLGVLDAAAFTPDGQSLAVLSAEMGEVTLWRAGDGTRIASFAVPPGSTIDAIASSLAFSSDGTQLATSLGATMNVSTGAVTSWKTGAPLETSLVVNPESLIWVRRSRRSRSPPVTARCSSILCTRSVTRPRARVSSCAWRSCAPADDGADVGGGLLEHGQEFAHQRSCRSARPADTPALRAATERVRRRPVIGTAIERSPSSSSWSTMA